MVKVEKLMCHQGEGNEMMTKHNLVIEPLVMRYFKHFNCPLTLIILGVENREREKER